MDVIDVAGSPSGRKFRRRLVRCLLALVSLGASTPGTLAAPPVVGFEEAWPWNPSSVIHHSADALGAHQIWATVQDSEGFVYAVGNSRLLQYDGTSWRSIADYVGVCHLAIGADDTIYLANQHSVAVFDRANGEVVSLLDRLPEDRREPQRVRRLLPTGDGLVVTRARSVHYLRQDGPVETLLEAEPSTALRDAFLSGERLLVDTAGLELLVFRLTDPGLEPPPPTSIAKPEPMAIASVVGAADDGGGAWVFTAQNGTYRLLDDRLEPLALPADHLLDRWRANFARRLLDGRILVTTRRGGAVALGSSGRIEEVFDRQRYPVMNDSTYHALEDGQGNLWISTDDGVVQVPRSPARLVVEPSQVEGSLHRAHRHQNRLYVATRTGLYRQTVAGNPPGPSELETVAGIDSGVWALKTADDVLLVGTYDGIFTLRDGDSGPEVKQLCPPLTVNFFRSRRFPGRYLSASSGGLRALHSEGGAWVCSPTIAEFEALVYQLVEADDRFLVKTSAGELLDLSFDQGLEEAPEIRRYLAPEGDFNLLGFSDRVLLSTEQQVFRYRGPGPDGSFPFEPDDAFEEIRPEAPMAQLLIEYEPDGDRLWLVQGNVLQIAERSGPSAPFVRRRSASDQLLYWSAVHRDPVVDAYWVTHRTGVFFWDPSFRRAAPLSGSHLRRVGTLRDKVDLPLSGEPPRLPFASNGLRFEFAAPVFDQVGPSDFQVRLEGFDREWSSWSSETTKEYTNLWEGSYRFRVRNRDRWGLVGAEDHFDFVVAPPAHRAPWAYGLYFLGLCGVVALALRAHRTKLARERAISERRSAQVEERGRLLRERDRLIGELEARNTELARFNYTVSHDLKNPLTTIKNFIGMARHDAARGASERLEQDFDRLEGAADRLHRLLDDLFALSQTEGRGKDHRALDFGEVVAVALGDLADLVAQTRAEVEVAEDLPEVWGDRRQLVELVRQLLGNALVFVDSSRRPRIAVRSRDGSEGPVFEFEDNGIGIEAQYHEKVFGLFERLDPDSEGTGVGLALAQRVVESHGGRLWVESDGAGKGSTFCFTLATGRSTTRR